MDEMEKYLRPTPAFDCDNEAIKQKARHLTEGDEKLADKAKSLFYFVRDEIKYNMYAPLDALELYRASRTLERGEGRRELYPKSSSSGCPSPRRRHPCPSPTCRLSEPSSCR